MQVYYNATKCGVELIDMKCAIYSLRRRTRRWLVAIFYRMLNITSVNSFILYMSYQNYLLLTRFKHHHQKRFNLPILQQTIKEDIGRVLGNDVPEERRGKGKGYGVDAWPSDGMEKRKTCPTWLIAKERKMAYKCIVCSKAICLECSKKIYLECAKEAVS